VHLLTVRADVSGTGDSGDNPHDEVMIHLNVCVCVWGSWSPQDFLNKT